MISNRALKLLTATLFFAFSMLPALSQQFKLTINEVTKNAALVYDPILGNYYYEKEVPGFSPFEYVKVHKKEFLTGRTVKSFSEKFLVRYPKFTDVVVANHKLYLMYQESNKGHRGYGDLMVTEIDTTDLTTAIPKVVAHTNSNDYDSKEHWLSPYNRDLIEASPDSTKFLFLFSNRSTPENIYISVTDNNYNILWERMENMNSNGFPVQVNDAKIDNQGNIYLCYTYHDTRKKKVPGEEKNHFALINQQKKSLDIKLDLRNLAIAEMKFKISKGNDTLFFGGFTYNEDLLVRSAFTGKLALKNFELVELRHEMLPHKFLEKMSAIKWAYIKESYYGMVGTPYPEIFITNNGCIAIIADISSGDEWYTPGLIYVNLNDESNIFCRIPRDILGKRLGPWNRYSAFPYNNQMIVFFNDTNRQPKKDIDGKPVEEIRDNKRVLFIAIIDELGNLSMEKVVEMQKDDSVASIDEIKQISSKVYKVKFQKHLKKGETASEVKHTTIEIN